MRLFWWQLFTPSRLMLALSLSVIIVLLLPRQRHSRLQAGYWPSPVSNVTMEEHRQLQRRLEQVYRQFQQVQYHLKRQSDEKSRDELKPVEQIALNRSDKLESIKKDQKNTKSCLDGSLVTSGQCRLPMVGGSSKNSKQDSGGEDARLAGLLAERLAALYRKRIQDHFFSSRCKQYQVIEYNCANMEMACGGFGNRSRGLVSLFYTALMTNSIFHVNWTIPVDLGLYFRQNADLYRVPASDFLTTVSCSPTPPAVVKLMDNDDDSLAFFRKILKKSSARKTSVLTNSLLGVSSAFISNKQRCPDSVCRCFEGFEPARLHSGILVSAALRVLYSEPTTALMAQIDRINATRQKSWPTSTKIGVQVRMENPVWFEKSRVALEQIPCFFEEVQRLIQGHKIAEPLVFVTGDVEMATAMLLQMFEHAKIAAFSDDVHGQVTHIDRNHLLYDERLDSANRDDIWLRHVRAFSDWWLLTKMDYLVISQGGFGETAHAHSLAPTRRFVHHKTTADGKVTYNDACTFQPFVTPPDLRLEPNVYITDPYN